MLSLLPLPRYPAPPIDDLLQDHRHRLGMAASNNRLVFVFGRDFGNFAPFSLANTLTSQLNLVDRYDFLIVTDADAFPCHGHIYFNHRPLFDPATNAPYAFLRADIPNVVCAVYSLIKANFFRPRLS